MTHVLDIQSLEAHTIEALIEDAQRIVTLGLHKTTHIDPLCANKTLVNCFFEPSTRTRISFELAAKRLGMTVVQFDSAISSTIKGETELDTLLTLQAMYADLVVMRHRENFIIETLSQQLPPSLSLINAGDGTHAHPTQALIDALTISQHRDSLHDLKITIVGDIAHSRVARSNITLFQKLGIKNIHLCGPDLFKPEDPGLQAFPWHTNVDEAIKDSDVVILLRIQNERLAFRLETQHYVDTFCLTPERFAFAKPDAILLHPGPYNRGVEIADEMLSLPACKILKQVENGVAMRMAIIRYCLSNKTSHR